MTAAAQKPQIDVRSLCQLATCARRAAVWTAWPGIGIVAMCHTCWDYLHHHEILISRTPKEWQQWIKARLRFHAAL